MLITYFVNQYPKVSHTFIRREILALEEQGFSIQRVALRGWDADVADETDKEEKQKTEFILESGVFGLLPFFFQILKASPKSFFSALKVAFGMRKMSERHFLYHIIYLFEACKLAVLCKNNGSQHIHAHFGTNSCEVAMLAKMLAGIDYSFTVHGPEEFDKPLGLHLKTKIKHAKFVAAISSFGRSQLFRWADYQDWNKIKIVHCGLDASFLTEEHSVHISTSDTRQLLCIGRLCEQKGQLLLLQAIKQVLDKGHKINLVLAGDGEMRPDVESFIQEHGLKDSITITGWISSSKVGEFLRESDAMILPSFAEGLPVAIMEAMALKTPVLTTYIAGIPELIKSGHNGILFPSGDVDAIEKGIVEFLAKSDDELRELANNAYASVNERHNINTEASKLASYIKTA